MPRPLIAALACALAIAPLAASAALPGPVAAVAANPARAGDVKLDPRRKGPDLLAFAEVKPSQKVFELIPGAGYFTRLLSLAVGPAGRVYATWPTEYDKVSHPDSDTMRKMATTAPFTNVRVLVQPAKAFSAPEPLDLVFTSQNYHDYPDPFMGKVDPAVLDRAVYKALKPGGLFVIVDHRGRPGTGITETDTLHRIDPAVVRQQVTAAGFRFEGESQILANPKDPLNIAVFDPSIRGRTSQFVMKFRKPR